MKVLVVVAMPNELKVVKERIKLADLKINLDIDYLCSGIGNYETISSLEHYLVNNPEPTFIRNIGVCGYWNCKYEIKSEPIQVASVINVHTEKEMIIPPFLQIAPLKTCFSGENVILESPKFKIRNGTVDDEMYFDMESRGVEFVSSKHKLPHLILKIPFDFIGGNDSLNKGNFKESIGKISELLTNLPYHDYLVKILKWINQQEIV